MSSGYNNQAGITLIELLVVIGMFALLSTLTLFFGLDFFRTYTFHSEQTQLASALSKARARSLANINGNQHGVRISGGNYILFQGAGPSLSWSDRDASKDEPIPVGTGVSALDHDILFAQLSGNATCTPDCTIDMSAMGATKQITINSQGAILW